MLVAEVLQSLAILGDRAAAWDPYGLQLGDPALEANKLGVCHEVTSEVLERAAGLDLLIAYHPLLFQPTNRLVAGRGPQGRAYELIRSGIALAVVHTAWDVAPGGTADALATMVGLRELEPFGAVDGPESWKLVAFVPGEDVDRVAAALTAAGAGRLGNYTACSFRTEGIGTFVPEAGSAPTTGARGELNEVSETRLEMVVPAGLRNRVVATLRQVHPYEEPAFDLYQTASAGAMVGRVGAISGRLSDLVARLESEIGPEVRAAGRDRTLARAAVLPGSGGSFVSEARSRGADVLITGDVNHHQMQKAVDLEMAVIDVGHAPSERPGVAALAEAVAKIGPELVEVDVDPTPWKRR